MKCYSCSRYDHIMSNCPLITLNIPTSHFIAKYYNKGEPNIRSTFTRSKFKYSAIKNNEITKRLLK